MYKRAGCDESLADDFERSVDNFGLTQTFKRLLRIRKCRRVRFGEGGDSDAAADTVGGAVTARTGGGGGGGLGLGEEGVVVVGAALDRVDGEDHTSRAVSTVTLLAVEP